MKTLLLVLSVLALCACETPKESSASLAAPVAGSSKIYIIGDEISKGDGVTLNYGQILASRSGKQVVNRSYSSTTGRDKANGIHSPGGVTSTMNTTLSIDELAGITPSDIIIIFVCYTDARWDGIVTNSANYTTFVPAFLTAAYNTGAQIYVVTPIKMNAAAYGLTALNQGSDAAMLSFANALNNSVLGFHSSGVRLVDMYNTFNPILANLQADMIFPNDAGHQIIADKLILDMGL